MHLARLLSVAILSSPLVVSAAPPVFSQSNVGGFFTDAFDVVAGDFTGDSLIDIMVTLPTSNRVSLLENPGGDLTGTFTVTQVANNAQGGSGIEAADFDQDGDLDIVVANQDADRLVWYENPQGEGGFLLSWVEHAIDTSAEGVIFTETGDFDGDGDIDVAASLGTDEQIFWYQNPGVATIETASRWDEFVIVSGAPGVVGIQVADFDNDGDPDVVGNLADATDVVWYQNPGGAGATGTWTPMLIDGDNAGNVYSIPGDFDADGAIDVAVVSESEDTVTLYFNRLGSGGTTWVPVVIGSPTLDPLLFNGVSRVDTADFDADGDLDVVVSASLGDNVLFFESPGVDSARDAASWNFESIASGLNANEPLGIDVADFDGNGSSDFAVALGDSNRVRLFLNPTVVSDPVTPVIGTISLADAGGLEITFDTVAGEVLPDRFFHKSHLS